MIGTLIHIALITAKAVLALIGSGLRCSPLGSGCQFSGPLRLQRVDDFQCSADIARQFGRIDQVRSGVGHVLAVVILLRVVVQLVQLIIERMCWMGCPAVADFADNIPEPILGDEAGRIRRTAIRLQDDAAAEGRRLGHGLLQM